jgi:hypothetical protein
MENKMTEDNNNEVSIEIVASEKQARDFLKSKRAISFLIWIFLVYAVTPLTQAAFPDVVFDVELVVNNLTILAGMVIGGYSAQDVAIALVEVVVDYFENK